MKKTWMYASVLIVALSANAGEIDGGAVVGSMVGAGVGSAVGSATGGKNGAIIGGGVGGALGAAVGSSSKPAPVREEKIIYVDREGHHDNGLHKGHRKHHHD